MSEDSPSNIPSILLSRRRLVTGSTAAAISANTCLVPSGNDPALKICEAWTARHLEYEGRIGLRQALESHLFRNHDWPRLSRRQRAALPEAVELDSIDDRLDELDAESHLLLASIPETPATTPRGLVAKLAIVATLVGPHENAEAHKLIKSIAGDFERLTQGR